MIFLPNHRTGYIAAAAVLLPAIFIAVSSHAAFAADGDSGARPSSGASAAQANRTAPKAQTADQTEARIAALHRELHIAADQDAQWNEFAQVMRSNARKMRSSIAERSSMLRHMSAVEDLHSYERVADEHAEGLKRLVPAFEALYVKMSPAQQKNADHVFGTQQRHATPRR
jgi:hypothetical protein